MSINFQSVRESEKEKNRRGEKVKVGKEIRENSYEK
jgi:hypothetical protein